MGQDERSQPVGQFNPSTGSAGSWRETFRPQAAVTESSGAPYEVAGGPAPQGDLSRAFEQFRTWASGAGSGGGSLTQPAAASASPSTIAPPWSPYEVAGGPAPQDDLSRALSQFMVPAGSATAGPTLPSSGQDSIASGSRSGRRLKLPNQVTIDDLVNWGLSIASGDARIRQVVRDVQSRFNVPTDTARRWFNATSKDGLSQRGRQFVDSSARHASHRAGLSAAQLQQFRDACSNGAAVGAALSSIGQDNILSDTARRWLDRSSADGFSERGRRLLRLLQKSPYDSNPSVRSVRSARYTSHGAGLSAAQFQQLRDVQSYGVVLEVALSSIGLGHISRNTASRWFDRSSDDGFSERGRRLLQKIQNDEMIDEIIDDLDEAMADH